MNHIQLAVLPATGDAPEPLKLVPAQSVQPLVPRGVLDEPGLVAEPVVTVLPHAVEVCLVLAVVTVGKLTVLIESEIIQQCNYCQRGILIESSLSSAATTLNTLTCRVLLCKSGKYILY